MPIGRPSKGADHVEKFEGSKEAKLRLRTILETIHGDLPVTEAIDRLKISESRFHQIRDNMLEAGLAALESSPKGRRARIPPEEASKMESMSKEIDRLRYELEKAKVLADVGLRFSRLAVDMGPPQKKESRKESRRKRHRK